MGARINKQRQKITTLPNHNYACLDAENAQSKREAGCSWMYFNDYIQFGLSPCKCEVGKPQYHYHICFCYYWHNKLRRQFVCAVVRVIESNYPMLGKWLCTKRNPSGIHKAISEVRQSWNVGALHINCSRSTTSFERTSQPRIGDDCTWFTQK